MSRRHLPTEAVAEFDATAHAVAQAGREKRWVALTSVFAAIVLTATKLIVGFATGSLGILSEAAHSALDLVAAVMTYFAVRVSDKPADREHQYGHGKVENLSALGETILLFITCFWIIKEAVNRLFFKEVPVEATGWSFAVIALSIVIDISRSRALMKAAKKHRSQALEADALHFSTDVWSSAVVLVGLGCVKLGDFIGNKAILEKADSIAALGVALIVISVSYRLGKKTIDVLLDRSPDGALQRVEDAIKKVGSVLGVKGIRMRESGHLTFTEITIQVERNLQLDKSYEIAKAVEDSVHGVLPDADVVVRIEPTQAEMEDVSDRVAAIGRELDVEGHHILSYVEDGKTMLELHMEVDGAMELAAAHALAHKLEGAIKADLKHIQEVFVHIECSHSEGLMEVTRREPNGIAETVHQIAASMPGVVECHEVTVRKAGSREFVSLHCTFEPHLSVSEVHSISSEIETRVRSAFPTLARVSTHAEPRGLEVG